MQYRIKDIFILLVLTQAFHSLEEYIGQLWVSFPPATYLCSLVADNPENGFLIINTAIFAFGLWCWLIPIKRNYVYAHSLIWFWIIFEMINSTGHFLWTLRQNAYTPGLITSPFLLALALILFRKHHNSSTLENDNKSSLL